MATNVARRISPMIASQLCGCLESCIEFGLNDDDSENDDEPEHDALHEQRFVLVLIEAET